MMKLKAFIMVFLMGLIVGTAHLDIEDQISSFQALGEDTTTAGLISSGLSPETAERISTISFKVGGYLIGIPFHLGQHTAVTLNLDNRLESKFASLK